MNRYVALVLSLVSLSGAAGLSYLVYRLVAWGLAGDSSDLWNVGFYALIVGWLGFCALIVGGGAMYTAITGREISASKNTGTAGKSRPMGYSGDDRGIWDV